MLLLVILVNLAVFALMAASTGTFDWDAQELLDWGGDLGALSLHGQPWRLLTANYLHAGVQHIFGNMVLLGITGAYVEPRIGPWRALAAYTVCGLAGSVLGAWAHPDVVGVGASGAIAGLLGLMVAFYASGRHPDISGRWIAQVVGINAIYSFAPGVDGLAHLGGFLAGLACGGVLLLWPPRPLAEGGEL